MALELESTIMREIGFGQHYTWHNGSGGCGGTRRAALKRLPVALQAHHDAGEAIAPPNHPLLTFLDLIELHEEADYLYSLTKTWQASSDAIRAHMEAGARPDEAAALFASYLDYFRRNYPKATREERGESDYLAMKSHRDAMLRWQYRGGK
jgi:hypothetical protein